VEVRSEKAPVGCERAAGSFAGSCGGRVLSLGAGRRRIRPIRDPIPISDLEGTQALREKLLHIFRNTPFGRETLMQSAYFCQREELELEIYVPRHPRFLMYFADDLVTVDLDRSFLRAPESAREHAEQIVAPFALTHRFYEPEDFTASTLPNLSTRFDFMSCPRSISDLSTKIGLGQIGSRVRSIVQQAAFPVLIPAAAHKPWRSVVAFFGGSANGMRALRRARRLAERAGVPLQIFTQAERPRAFYEEALSGEALLDSAQSGSHPWLYFEGGEMRENLYALPHDALVVTGAYGQSRARDLLFGSKLELIQSIVPNPLLIVGPHCSD